MASNKINELTKSFKNNSQVKKITSFFRGKNNNKYYQYPNIKDDESVNNFIGTYCPMGYYKLNKNGAMKIISDRPILSQSKQLDNNLKDFSCYNSSCNSNSSNTDIVEGYENINKLNNSCNKLFIIAIFMIIFCFIFLRK